MKRIVSAILCLVFVFSVMQLPVSAASEEASNPGNSTRLTYIYDANVNIGKFGDYVLASGQLSCKANLVEMCTVNVTIYSRDRGSSDPWTYMGSGLGSGDNYCSGMKKVTIDTTKEYRGKLHCAAHPIDPDVPIEYLTLYTDIYRP